MTSANNDVVPGRKTRTGKKQVKRATKEKNLTSDDAINW
jgi:hypothetical protein